MTVTVKLSNRMMNIHLTAQKSRIDMYFSAQKPMIDDNGLGQRASG